MTIDVGETTEMPPLCLDVAAPAPRAGAPRRPLRIARPRSPWNAISVLAGIVLGLSFGGLVIAGERVASEEPQPSEEARVAAPILRAAAAPLAAPAPASTSPASTAVAPIAVRPFWRARQPNVTPATPPPATTAPPVQRAAPWDAVGINAGAAATAIDVAAARAGACVAAGDARTSMPVRVTFAPSGRVTSATVTGGPFAGTEVGSCVATALRAATVGPFDGLPVTFRRSVQVR